MNNDENANLIDDQEEATIGMKEIDAFDFGRAGMLMSIMEKVANVGVKSTAIGGLAAAALNEMNEEAKAIARRRAEEFAKAEAAAAQKLAIEQRKREEAEAEEQEEAQKVNLHPQPPVARAIPSRPTTPAPDTRRV